MVIREKFEHVKKIFNRNDVFIDKDKTWQVSNFIQLVRVELFLYKKKKLIKFECKLIFKISQFSNLVS